MLPVSRDACGVGPAAVSPSEMLAKLFQHWFAYLSIYHLLCCRGAHVLLGERDCLATGRMLVHALWASSAAEVVGFGKWFGKGSDLPLSAGRPLFSPYAGLYPMMSCRKGVALLRGCCDNKHPGHQQLVETGTGRWGWPHVQLRSP